MLSMGCASNHIMADLIRQGDCTAVKDRLTAENVNVILEDKETPLMLASYCSSSNMVALLIKLGADVNLANEDGWTPLCYAAVRVSGDIEVAKLLVDNGADVNMPADRPPLVISSTYGHIEFAKYLLENGANPNHPPALALVCAIEGLRDVFRASGEFGIYRKPDMSIIELLIDYGANINAQIELTGITPLMIACSYGDIDVVVELIKRGADINAQTQAQYGQLKAIDFAENNGYPDIVKVLADRGGG